MLFLGYSQPLFGGIFRKSPSSPISMRVFAHLRSGGIPPRVRLTDGTRTPVSVSFRRWICRRPNSVGRFLPAWWYSRRWYFADRHGNSQIQTHRQVVSAARWQRAISFHHPDRWQALALQVPASREAKAHGAWTISRCASGLGTGAPCCGSRTVGDGR